MELTKQDYQSALEIWSSYCFKTDNELTFPGYIEVKLDELEEQKPQFPQYRCIQLPPANNGMFEIGILYSEKYYFLGFNLSDLPKHFELIVPEPKPEKITWEEVRNLIYREINTPRGIEILKRIKTDHLS